jgi:broad specificity phosphatase PhoE
MAIYLIRHGETDLNRARVVQVPETPLSDNGREQARRLGRRLVGLPIERLLASDLARADETACAVSAAIGVAVEREPLLQERNFGAIRGTAYADLAESPFAPGYAPPEGETWEAFHARVDAAWDRIREIAAPLSGHLAVVTHGLVLHSLAARHLALPDGLERAPHDGPPFAFGNTALSITEAAAPFRVTLFRCTAHLDDEATQGISGL